VNESAAFYPTGPCWVCGGASLTDVHEAILEFSAWREQDPELAALSGTKIALVRCSACGFAQPSRTPALPRFFERMYDQRWSADWVAQEFESTYKDLIFRRILDGLRRRLPATRRSLLDVGCHAGRFLTLAREAGWTVEGTEINPRTAAHAAAKSGAVVHRLPAERLHELPHQYDAVTLTDVLEHIPEPVTLLSFVRRILRDDGWIAIKVPCGPSQLLKETWRARLNSGYRATVADNLVHVNHFSANALTRALWRSGFDRIDVELAPPECPASARFSNMFRLGLYNVSRALPGAINTPLALHLQAFAHAAPARDQL
jgi:SAM-dependent methyltransferase